MQTRLTEDELAVQDAFRTFFANESPSTVVREAERTGGFSTELWAGLATIGGTGMALPGAVGGGDATLCDLAVVADVYGAHLAPVPLIEHAVAARLLATIGGHDELVGELANGTPLATIALRPPVDGIARFVPAGAVADVVLAHVGDGIVLDRSAPSGETLPNTGGLALAHRRLTDDVISVDHAAWNHALDEWRGLTAAAYVGLGRRVIEMGVEYSRERVQFGVPIGTFQALQQGYADASTRIEGAHLLAHRAVWALETRQPDASRLAGMALLFAAEAARFATDRSMQYHGGYGFSEEYDVQLYHRRATAWILQLGDPSLEYARLADGEFGPAVDGRMA
jgi:alkylation response protein AidB-like acyl-CoA dehydrogenase